MLRIVERDDLQAHALEVRLGQLAHGGDQALALAVDVLDREPADRRAHVTLDRLHRGAHDVVAAAREELLGGALDALVGGVDLDHADAVDLHRHAVRRVGLRGRDVELHELERQPLDLLAERPHVGAAAAHDPVAVAALGGGRR